MTEDGVGKLEYIDFLKLCDLDCDLSENVERAFGADGLGIIAVSHVPGYVELRERLLPLASKLAFLAESSPDFKDKYEDAKSSYNVGWSCGRETLQDGTPDTSKGSFYANPLCDAPTTDAKLLEKYPHYTRPNVWPREELPELEGAFKQLGKMIHEVGMLVLHQCLKCLEHHGIRIADGPLLQDSVNSTMALKGRLLCYLPLCKQMDSSPSASEMQQNWCGWHKDHGALTGLTSAMYIRSEKCEDGELEIIDCPDPRAGLRIKDRKGKIISIRIPADCIAFQIGEVLEILSKGILMATPHCVSQPETSSYESMKNICRNTFALFMQPQWDFMLKPLDEKDHEGTTKTELQAYESFGEFSARRFETYYN